MMSSPARPTTYFYFHGELNDFLPASRKHRWIDYALEMDGSIAIKHPIEALGVPHPEVEHILVDGAPAGFAHRLRAGERVQVYPLDHNLPTRHQKRLRPPLEHPPRFVVDTHLGKLAAYLRMLGYDTAYRNDYDDEQLAHIAHQQRRVLLTRDRGLLKRKIVTYGHCVRQSDPRGQLVDSVRRYRLEANANPWTRCLRCNGPLVPVDKAAILDELEPKTKLYYDDFQRCAECGQIYWRGSHHERMRRFMESALAEARSLPTPSP
jgi:uncharacterized protein with PIN domain